MCVCVCVCVCVRVRVRFVSECDLCVVSDYQRDLCFRFSLKQHKYKSEGMSLLDPYLNVRYCEHLHCIKTCVCVCVYVFCGGKRGGGVWKISNQLNNLASNCDSF